MPLGPCSPGPDGVGRHERPGRALPEPEQTSELLVLLGQGRPGHHEEGQGVQLGLEAQGVLRPEAGIWPGLPGSPGRASAPYARRAAATWSWIAGREIEGDDRKDKEDGGDGEIPAPATLLRRFGEAAHGSSGSMLIRGERDRSGGEDAPVLLELVQDPDRPLDHAGQGLLVHVDGEVRLVLQQAVEPPDQMRRLPS
jgi:hypothetical protein